MAVWIKNKKDKDGCKFYPECSNCGYHWIEEMIGVGIHAKSNLKDAHYCPYCGEKIEGIKEA